VNSRSRMMVTIDASSIPSMKAEISTGFKKPERATSHFAVYSTNGDFTVIGTMDEILDMSSNITAAVYSWLIQHHHDDWLAQRRIEMMEGEDGNAESSAG
jgi:hypothetical protein